MRGKEIQFIGNQLTIQDLNSKPVVIVIDKGKAKMYELPPHGQTIVKSYQGSVPRVEFNESEEF